MCEANETLSEYFVALKRAQNTALKSVLSDLSKCYKLCELCGSCEAFKKNVLLYRIAARC